MIWGSKLPNTLGTMNREQLAVRLPREGVPETHYHLYGAHFEGRHVLDHRSTGWFVFYSERGGEFSVRRFETESGACAEIYARLLRDQPSGRDE